MQGYRCAIYLLFSGCVNTKYICYNRLLPKIDQHDQASALLMEKHFERSTIESLRVQHTIEQCWLNDKLCSKLNIRFNIIAAPSSWTVYGWRRRRRSAISRAIGKNLHNSSVWMHIFLILDLTEELNASHKYLTKKIPFIRTPTHR